jgi:hypothetical protein
MKIIKAKDKNKEYEVLVDDEDFDYLNQFNWRINRNGYPVCVHSYQNFTINAAIAYDIFAKKIYLNDVNKLNFQNTSIKEEDRVNKLINNPKKIKGKSQYKGVNPKGGKYQATIRHNRKSYSAGYYDTEIEAAKAYNKKAIELHGDKARLNIFNE